MIPALLILELALPVLRRRSLASPMIARPEPGIVHLARQHGFSFVALRVVDGS